MVDRIGTHGGALVVRGEAGIGKSALLRAAAERAHEQGATVVSTTGTQSEARLAFGALHQLLLPFLDRLGDLPDPQRRALDIAFGVVEGDAPDVFLIGLATLGVLTESAATTPLLVVVDDAHWLDRSSAEVLAFVARRLDMEVGALALRGPRRRAEPPRWEPTFPSFSLSGLDDATSRTLLDVNGATLTADLQKRILAEAAGNPLALIELPTVTAGLESTLIWQPLPLTARLEAAFTTRLNALDADVPDTAAARGARGRRGHRAEPRRRRAPRLARLPQRLDEGGRIRPRNPRGRQVPVQAPVDAVGGASGGDGRAAPPSTRRARTDARQPIRTGPCGIRQRPQPDQTSTVAEALMGPQTGPRRAAAIDVAFAALERAAALTADPGQRALRLQEAGEIACEQGRPDESIALLREALQLGLPAQEAVRTSFNLETMTSVWSGASTIPRFAEITKDIAAGGDDLRALDGLDAIGMRAHWGPLEETTRQHVSAIVARLAVPVDEPQRLSALALIDPVHRAGGHRSTSGGYLPSGSLIRWTRCTSAWPQRPSGPTTSRCRSCGPLWRHSGPTGDCSWSGSALHRGLGQRRRGAVRMAITGAAEGARVVGRDRPCALRAHREPRPCHRRRRARRGGDGRTPDRRGRGGAAADGSQPPALGGRAGARPNGPRS